MELEERFWSKTRPVGECIEWTGAINSRGYGGFWLNAKMRLAHRVSYELSIGPIPESLTLDHLCRNRACVNPDHLEPCSLRENILHGIGPTAINAKKTECIHGHPFTDENTRFRGDGNSKQCRTCESRRWRERLAAN